MDNQINKVAKQESHPMNFLLSEDFNIGIPVAGEMRTGVVVSNHNNNVLVDIGAKSEAIIHPAEFGKMDEETRSLLEVGEEILVYIVNPENKEGEILVSFLKALEEQDWHKAQELFNTEEVFEGTIIGFNKGGLLTKIGRVRGFIPSSQLSNNRQFRAGFSDLQSYVGKQIFTKVIEVDRSRNRLILSERAADKEVRAAKRTELLASLAQGDVITGKVVNLADFGAFIDIGGMEGLIHVSELTWKRNVDLNEFFTIGQEIEVYVLSVDNEKQRVALSTKRLESDPWELITDKYHVGQLVSVTVTKLTEYGAFARLNDSEYDFEGLIHISELAEDHVKHPSQVLHKGQELTARIIRIVQNKKQIGLSLKQVTSDKFMVTDLAWASITNSQEEE